MGDRGRPACAAARRAVPGAGVARARRGHSRRLHAEPTSAHLHRHPPPGAPAVTRLYLLRLRGREPAPGTRASSRDRFRAASVDVAFCLTVARMTGRPRWARTLTIGMAYHVACWSTTGRTLGGMVMRQRVVSVDGSRLTPTQSLLRLALSPASWLMRRPLHDELASTEVIAD